MSHRGWRCPTLSMVLVLVLMLGTGLVSGRSSTAQDSKLDRIEIPINLELVIDGLVKPVLIVDPNDGTGRMFIVEQVGFVLILENGVLLDTPFLDITGKVRVGAERGMLSIVFHPNFRDNRQFFIDYTDRRGNTRIERWTVSKDDPNVADPNSVTRIITIEHPGTTHQGGLLLFGPDGYLYIGHGDGGFQGDPRRNGQNLKTLLGKILRIDVDNPLGNVAYRIPPGNPFVNVPGARGEIWAFGLRNPWRFSFDRETGDLYVTDVGNDKFEEINVLPAGVGGQNLGWVVMEGPVCFKVDCDTSLYDLPLFWYTHGDYGGCAIAGGYVYRGKAIPELRGRYLAGDFCTGKIWTLDLETRSAEITSHPGLQITSFGERADGELFVVDYAGAIYLIVP